MTIHDSDPNSSVPELGPPTRAGGPALHLQHQWKVGQRLGSGGFGQVFSATGEDGTPAAVKFVPKVPGAERELLFANLDGIMATPCREWRPTRTVEMTAALRLEKTEVSTWSLLW